MYIISKILPASKSKRLYLAAEKGDLATVQSLLESLTIEEINRERFMWNQIVRVTALHGAVFHDRPDIVRAILSRDGVNVNHEYFHERIVLRYTVLHLAAVRNLVNVVKLLAAYPATDVNAKDYSHKTALYYAVNSRCIESVQALLAHPRINVKARDKYGRTVLMAMCSSRELPETEYYWYMFQNPGRMNANSATIMDILLAHPDINVNEKDNSGCSALSLAMSGGPFETVTALLVHPHTDVNIRDTEARTPLWLAAMAGNVESVKAAIQCPSIDVNAKNKAGLTPLLATCGAGEAYRNPVGKNINFVVEALLAHPNISVNEQSADGTTALMSAAKHRYVNTVKHLLQHPDINCNLIDKEGNTALHGAIFAMVNTQYDQQKRYTEYFNIVLAICAHPGTDKSIEKKDGGTAFLLGAAFIQAVNQQIKSGKIKCLKMFDELEFLNALDPNPASGKIVSMNFTGRFIFARQPVSTAGV